MAKKKYRPGQRLVVFFVGVAVLFGLAAMTGTWKPQLGLDLQGGTRITLIAEGKPTKENMELARQIIDKRVNGSGVVEPDVNVQDNRFIVVEIPGKNRRDLIETVERTAQLRFRLVATNGVAAGTPAPPAPSPSTAPSGTPTGTPSGKPSTAPSGSSTPKAGATSTPKPRPAPKLADETNAPKPTADPTLPLNPSQTQPAAPQPQQPQPQTAQGASVDDPIAWASNPGAEWYQKFAQFVCPDAKTGAPVVDDPAKPLITCDEEGNKYLLSKTVIEGTSLKSASSGIQQGQAKWTVNLNLKGKAVGVFDQISRALFANNGLFAIVLDGRVISAPGFTGVINNGVAQITGNFDEDSATSLANSLKYGALPVKFGEPSSDTIGPSLAGNQLSAGLWAGGVGFALVMLYCLIYYRGLGTVVLASLLVAAAMTYALVLVLSKAAGFTLTLPGIAGLIIGVGVTADSFVIFFERIRDEMREGKSMRVAVETGWVRARKTRMAANVVSLLSAAVLYIFATGVVKGFGFALGLSTLVDLAVLFWFTKHAVSYLARFKFFNGGGELSGLSRATLGMDAEPEGGRV